MSHRHLSILFVAAAMLCTFSATVLFAGEVANKEEVPPVMKFDDPSWNLNFSAAESIAIQDGGRKKPFQTYAFEAVEQMCGRPLMGSTFIRIPLNPAATDAKDRQEVKFNAMDLFMSIWCHPKYWEDKPVILVSNSELRKQINPNDPAGRTDKYMSVRTLANSDSLMKMLEGSRRKKDGELGALEAEAQLVWTRMNIFKRIIDTDSELALIPHVNSSSGAWAPMTDLKAALASDRAKDIAFGLEKSQRASAAFDAFKDAYRARVAGRFEQASAELRDSLRDLSPKIYPPSEGLALEVKYNGTRPFAWAWMLYLGALIIATFALKLKTPALYYSAWAFYLAGFGMHVYGFAMRCMIAGRPPVSNMYESVIWVGSGAVFFGLVFELIYRRRLFMISGAVGGFLCLVLMDLVPVLIGNVNAPGFESRINPLEPVLRDNFWLTVHVLTITLSYAAFMLAWALGHITLGAHIVTPTARIEHNELHQFIYRVLQVGVLLLAIGTMLGGVWAYYSWGRFWGWDPKETWAFIALMCYLVVLHGRFAGFWGNFGNAFGSVFCFLSVVMAWYGVNFVLGSGKHAYGSGAGGLEYVGILVALDMVFLTVATIVYLKSKSSMSAEEAEELVLADESATRGQLTAGE